MGIFSRLFQRGHEQEQEPAESGAEGARDDAEAAAFARSEAAAAEAIEALAADDDPSDQPAAEAVVEPVVEPVIEPVVEAVVEPVVEPTPAPLNVAAGNGHNGTDHVRQAPAPLARSHSVQAGRGPLASRSIQEQRTKPMPAPITLPGVTSPAPMTPAVAPQASQAGSAPPSMSKPTPSTPTPGTPARTAPPPASATATTAPRRMTPPSKRPPAPVAEVAATAAAPAPAATPPPADGRVRSRHGADQSITDAFASIMENVLPTGDASPHPESTAAAPVAPPVAPVAPATRSPVPDASDAASAPAGSRPDDLAVVQQLFSDMAVVHVAQVRDVMLELRFGDVACAWMESSRAALRSLRAMAEQLELGALCAALDAFCAAVDGAVAAGQPQISDDAKVELLRRYDQLIELIPQAFELDAERDRREPIIVESLLRQVDGVETLTIDKLFAVGLSRLDALMRANAGDMAAAAGIRPELAASIVERIGSYRAHGGAAVSALDAAQEQRELGELLRALKRQHREFEQAASSWSDDARNRKRELRKERDQTFLQVRVALARLGERDRINRLEKLPFEGRIEVIEGYLAEMACTRSRPTQAAPSRSPRSRGDRGSAST
jgi:hypothetical protein